MVELFNELMECLALVVSMFFNKLEFIDGLGIGWVFVAISCIGLVIMFMIGRTH